MSDRLHTALYQRALFLLPPRFRRRYAPQMAAAFREDLNRLRVDRPGRAALTGFWLRTVADLAVTAASEWLPSRKSRVHPADERRNGMMLSGLLRDVRYGMRSLRRARGFTLLAVLIVGLGVGANATVFAITRALLWEDPPLVFEPESLVRITRATSYTLSGGMTYPDYVHYRDENEVFDGLMAYEEDGYAVSMSHGDAIETVRLGNVSDNYFDVLGIRMALGREFTPEEDRAPGEAAVVVLSHALWTRSFGADSTVIGRRLALNGHPFTVIGVAPRTFAGVSPIERSQDVWTPLNMYGVLRNEGQNMLARIEGEIWNWLSLVGRLRDGVTVEMARSNLEGLAGYLAENYAEWNEGQSVHIAEHIGYRPNGHSTVVTIARLLMSVVGLVMIVAAANMAMILLARGSTRHQEISVRLALGAGRWRVIRQLVLESGILGVAGAVLGFVLSIWAAGPVTTLLPTEVTVPVTPDVTVFGFAMALGIVVVIVFGSVPALRSTRIGDAARVTADHERSLVRMGLVAGQVALSVVIVSGAILFSRSLRNARAVDMGFETHDRLIVSFNLRSHGYASEDIVPFLTDLLPRVRALPGVTGVTTARMIPFQGSWGSSFAAPGVTPPNGQEMFDAGFNAVGPDYFEVMRVPLVAGRGFSGQDGANADPVLVVNQALARDVWGTEDAVGRSITWRDRTWTVVGVARDGTYYNLGEDPQTQIIAPVMQAPLPGMGVIVATAGDPLQVARPVMDIVQSIDPNIAITATRTMQEVFDEEIGRYRVAATMVGVFGVVGVLLAAVGLYGVLSFLVAQRTREIGVRMALGASSQRVAGEVVRRGVRVAAFGIVIGLFASFAAARLVTSFLFGINATDPVTFATAALLLAGVAALASVVPARRAARVDPMSALRCEP